MTEELTYAILRVVERGPQWIRRDLDPKGPVARTHAEETHSAMTVVVVDSQADGET